MNKEEPLRDQAERLRKRIAKKDSSLPEVDAEGALPPRSRVHQHKKKRTRWRLKYPIIRLLALFFILLPIVCFSLYTINENNKKGETEPVSTEQENYETVNFDNGDEDHQQDEKENPDDNKENVNE